jgi:asparagine synthase (glutamine-hydrolysing)
MSAIAGLVFLNGRDVLPEQMPAMLAPLYRRGPDRRDTWHHGNAGFGQTLLATTPEATAEHQPWVCAASGCVVVSDSRLDDRDQLARALGLTDRPVDSIGDAELLHAAWQRWGSDCVEHLLGDFAFAIWDPREQRLFCARDPMGVRPLYIHFAVGRLFAFASQPDALFALPQIPFALNEARILDFLVEALEGIDKTSTFFRFIERLPPAHVLTLHNGQLTTTRYWQPVGARPLSENACDAEWIDGLRDHFARAVQRRVRANGAVGSMLSGGLDSSSIVAVASRQLSDAGRPPLCTFSAVTSDHDCAETLAIRSMLAHTTLDATLLDLNAMPDMLDAVARDWPLMGEPFDASMTLVECQYRAAAERGVRVVLDGVDADSLLSEGDLMVQLLGAGKLRSLWHEARGQVRFYKGEWSTWSFLRPAVTGALAPDLLKTAARHLRGSRDQRVAIQESLVRSDFCTRIDLTSRMRQLNSRAAWKIGAANVSGTYSPMESAYTTAGVERYGRVAARQAVEPRHPFLDRDLIEYCAWLPLRLRLHDGWPKWALRAAMADLLPHDVAWRRGKEHLGWQFNLAVYPRVARLTASDTATHRARLEPYVRIAELPPWPTNSAELNPPHPQWEAHSTALALQIWLTASDATMTKNFHPTHAVPFQLP